MELLEKSCENLALPLPSMEENSWHQLLPILLDMDVFY